MLEIIVIDSDVFVAATRSASGASYRLWQLLPSKRFVPALSVPLVTEYEDAAKRVKQGKVLSDGDIEALINDICSFAHLQDIFYLWRPFLRDAHDDHVLELAVASSSKTIVTFNTKDFVGVEQFCIQVVTPQEYLRKVGEIK